MERSARRAETYFLDRYLKDVGTPQKTKMEAWRVQRYSARPQPLGWDGWCTGWSINPCLVRRAPGTPRRNVSRNLDTRAAQGIATGIRLPPAQAQQMPVPTVATTGRTASSGQPRQPSRGRQARKSWSTAAMMPLVKVCGLEVEVCCASSTSGTAQLSAIQKASLGASMDKGQYLYPSHICASRPRTSVHGGCRPRR